MATTKLMTPSLRRGVRDIISMPAIIVHVGMQHGTSAHHRHKLPLFPRRARTTHRIPSLGVNGPQRAAAQSSQSHTEETELVGFLAVLAQFRGALFRRCSGRSYVRDGRGRSWSCRAVSARRLVVRRGFFDWNKGGPLSQVAISEMPPTSSDDRHAQPYELTRREK